jgi:6-phosphogluconate dehydrogenase
VVAWNRSPEPLDEVAAKGAKKAVDFADMVRQLPAPRVIWCMLPSGETTEKTLRELSGLLSDGDILVDGANSNYRDTVRRHDELAGRGIRLVDCGVSGGVVGATAGYCIMAGGEPEAFKRIEGIVRDLAQPDGARYVGKSGAGHFVKMVHNGIEYALMQAYGEGFNLLEKGPYTDLDLGSIAALWQKGSIISSFLLEETRKGLLKDPHLTEFEGMVADSGEGQWTIQTALEYQIPVETIAAALFSRYNSRKRAEFAHKVVSMQRKQFGGHTEKQK